MGENRAMGEMACKKATCIEVRGREERTAEILIPGLPSEIAIFCIARVPRSNHRNMTGVCRSWRNLVYETVLSETRRKLSLTEEWLYLWTYTANAWRCFDPCSQKWSKLPTMPNDNRIHGYSGFAAFHQKLFVIGGYLPNSYDNDNQAIPCTTVSYFDVRSYCWKRAADLNIARAQCMVGIIDDQMYVFGGDIEGAFHRPQNMITTVEVYDPIKDTWRFVSDMKIPLAMHDSVVMGEKFYAIGTGDGVVYDAKTDNWEDMANGLKSGWWYRATILDGKLYAITFDHEVGDLLGRDLLEGSQVISIKGYNPSNDTWEIVGIWDASKAWEVSFVAQELELVSFSGKLCVLCIWTDAAGSEEFSSIFMEILEVNELTEDLTYTTTFKDEFKIDYEHPDSQPFEVKRCHVIAL